MWLDWSNAMSITISITTYIIEIARPFLYLRVCSNTTPIRLFVTNLCHGSLGAELLQEIHKLQRTARFPAFMRPHFDVSPSRDDLEMFPHQSVKSQPKFVRINQNFDVCKSTAFFLWSSSFCFMSLPTTDLFPIPWALFFLSCLLSCGLEFEISVPTTVKCCKVIWKLKRYQLKTVIDPPWKRCIFASNQLKIPQTSTAEFWIGN